MALIPLAYKLDWYDPSKPGGLLTTTNNNVNTVTSLDTQYTMQDVIDTVIAGGSTPGINDRIPVYQETSPGQFTLAPSAASITYPSVTGANYMILRDAYSMVLSREAGSAGGDPEFVIVDEAFNYKVSMGWDDDGDGFGYLYNWAGDGWRIGANGNNPMLEVVTTPGSESVSLHKQVEFIDYGSGTYTGTAAFSLAVDASGNVIETAGGGIPWPYQYDVGNGTLLQGENPATTQVGVTTFGVGAGANLGPTSGGASGDSGNTAFGFNAMNLENNEVQCTAIGYKALGNQNVSPAFAVPSNTAIGYAAGMECTLSLADTFVGAEIKSVNAGQSTNNVGVGRSCLKNMQDGFANVALGAYALENLVSNNENIAIGWQANNGASPGNNNIVIGHQAQPSGTVNNEITIGNTNHDRFRLPGSLPSFDDDAAAGTGGILTNMLYQTTGAGAAPLNVAGIVMIKQ